MIKITIQNKIIRVDCTSYVLLKEAKNVYNEICNEYIKYGHDIDKFLIHEQVLDILLIHLSRVTNIDFLTTDNRGVYCFFGAKVEPFKY